MSSWKALAFRCVSHLRECRRSLLLANSGSPGPTHVQESNKGKVTILCIRVKLYNSMTVGQTWCFLSACNMKLFQPLPILYLYHEWGSSVGFSGRSRFVLLKHWNLIAAPRSKQFLPTEAFTCESYIEHCSRSAELQYYQILLVFQVHFGFEVATSLYLVPSSCDSKEFSHWDRKKVMAGLSLEQQCPCKIEQSCNDS